MAKGAYGLGFNEKFPIAPLSNGEATARTTGPQGTEAARQRTGGALPDILNATLLSGDYNGAASAFSDFQRLVQRVATTT